MIEIKSDIDKILIGLPLHLQLRKNVLEDLAEIVRKDIEQNIQQGTGLDGKGLAPKKTGGRLLYQTGELAKSVQKRVGATEANIFILLPYAKHVNYGTKYMPSRVFFGVSQRAMFNFDKYIASRSMSELFIDMFNK